LRLFLDANVLFSAAHNPSGNAHALFSLAAMGRIILVASRYAIEEASRNIALKCPDRARELESLLAGLVVGPEPAAALVSLAVEAGLPDKDAPILAAAIVASADLLVTGDRRHFGLLYGAAVQGVLILPPADAVIKVLDYLAPES